MRHKRRGIPRRDFGGLSPLPDRRLFQGALTELQVCPEAAIFIGNDRFRDVLGARQAGMKTILFCPHGNPGGSTGTEPDYVFYQHADLPRAIDFFVTNSNAKGLGGNHWSSSFLVAGNDNDRR
jgi:phosphoglycolate phosphatase-like HAD superfamily hydrolase